MPVEWTLPRKNSSARQIVIIRFRISRAFFKTRQNQTRERPLSLAGHFSLPLPTPAIPDADIHAMLRCTTLPLFPKLATRPILPQPIPPNSISVRQILNEELDSLSRFG